MSAPALWTQHRRLARAVAREYFWAGAERQDVEQEALIALWEAARDFDGTGSFKGWARLIIGNHLKDCMSAANRGKQQPLNRSVREFVSDDGFRVDAADVLPCLHQVSELVEDREHLRAVLYVINHDLTDLERHAVIGLARGLSYAEIGDPKLVDNAIQRARRKLKAAA